MNAPIKFESDKGTNFTVIGDNVEINRHDQPVGYIPLSDLLAFVGQYLQTPNAEIRGGEAVPLD